MALVIAKKFLRSMAQPFEHDQRGVSLWTVDDIISKQRGNSHLSGIGNFGGRILQG